MRGIQAKRLMTMAREERADEKGVVERELVPRRRDDETLINSPFSIRAMYLKLKRRFNFLSRFSGAAQSAVARVRKEKMPQPKASSTSRRRGAQAIEKPLDWILGHCPPTQRPDGSYEMHPVYRDARRAANRGRGDVVKRIAASFA